VETVRSPLMQRFAMLLLLGDCVGTVIYALLADYSHVTFTSAEERTNFAAGIDLYANLLQVGLQLLVTRELMVWFGAKAAFVMDGAVKALMLLGLILAEADLLAEERDELPLLLLDDVTGEFDAHRRALLLDAVARFDQAILTSTDEADLGGRAAAVVRVSDGEARAA